MSQHPATAQGDGASWDVVEGTATVERGQFPTNRYVVFYSELASDQPFFVLHRPPNPPPTGRTIKRLRD